MPENYDEMMDKALEATANAVGAVVPPGSELFNAVEQVVYEYVREEENGS